MIEVTVKALPEYVEFVSNLRKKEANIWYRGVEKDMFEPKPRIIWDKESQIHEKH